MMKRQIVKSLVQSVWVIAISVPAPAHANDDPYVLLDGGRLTSEPYRWMLPDGTVLKKGLSDAGGKAFLTRAPGRTGYVLETLWGHFKVNVPAECWDRAPEAFQSCAQWSPREDPQAQREDKARIAREAQEKADHKNARIAWAITEVDPAVAIYAAVKEHYAWMKSAAAELGVSTFSCRMLALPNPGAEATDWFEKARSMPSGREQDMAYARAAGLGHWRAAARLASLLLDDEDWEGATPVIAWLISRNIPAGYNKLADLIMARGSYDGASLGEAEQRFLISLRWRAAQAGDPVAQAQMSKFFRDAGQQELATALLDCARRQNPEIR
jgi:hypothetical protein